MSRKSTLIVAILAISVLLFAFIFMPITNINAATTGHTDTTITRTLSSMLPSPDSTFEVTLNITGLRIGGIVETIPVGFAFINTTHPSNQTHVSGQKVVFVVLNETSIRYEVRAPSRGSGTFSGTWYDAMSEEEGDIESTHVSVRMAEASPISVPAPPVPGFEVVYALAGLLVVAVAVLHRSGGDSCE